MKKNTPEEDMPGTPDYKMRKIKEGSAEIFVPAEKKVSKKLPVFYNPAMKLNRDATVLLLNAEWEEPYAKAKGSSAEKRICDPLAGSGIRSIRLAKEIKRKDISITANDLSRNAFELIRRNMLHNKAWFEVYNKDANLLLLESSGFDYIDLDVFGSPNFLLDSSVRRVSRGGIIALTATDTSALSGTYLNACLRKYWAVPSRTEIMHEAGIRILARKAQLIGAQYDKALTPIYSYWDKHYFRVFLKCEKGKSAVDSIMRQHMRCIGPYKNPGSWKGWQLHEPGSNSNKVGKAGSIIKDWFGPLWAGQLWDRGIAKKMVMKNGEKENQKLLEIIAGEAETGSLFFFDIQKASNTGGLGFNPKKGLTIESLNSSGYKASETHFSGRGIRTDAGYKEFVYHLKS